MQRGHRLSRSRDFDAVYRHGRSVSTRYLVLYWFERENSDKNGPRLGIAVPKKVGGSVIRNRMKRQLREAWERTRTPAPRNDYVLVVRPGLPEAVEARGFDWLEERIGEVLRRRGVKYLGSPRLAYRWLVAPRRPGAPTCKFHPAARSTRSTP